MRRTVHYPLHSLTTGMENYGQMNARTGSRKLRTYRLFKSTYRPEIYLCENLPRSHMSAFAKFRCGTAQIRIETGRYEHIPLEDRTCFLLFRTES